MYEFEVNKMHSCKGADFFIEKKYYKFQVEVDVRFKCIEGKEGW